MNLLWIFFFFPETAFPRTYDTGLDSPNPSIQAPTADEEKSSSATELHDSPNSASNSTPKPKKSFLQELKPWSPIDPNANLLVLFLRPWPLVLYPGLIFSFLTFAAVLGWLVCVINTNASIYQLPPYNMSPGINNLINLPAFIGCILGAYVGGALSDRLAERSARRNGGIFEPESRLVALVFPFFLVPVGLLMY